MSELVVELYEHDSVPVLKLVGEARLQFAELERQILKLTAGRPTLVVVDVTGLTFCSSLGMGALVSIRNAVRRQEGRVRLAGMQQMVEGAFRRASLLALFDTFPTLDAALSGEAAQ